MRGKVIGACRIFVLEIKQVEKTTNEIKNTLIINSVHLLIEYNFRGAEIFGRKKLRGTTRFKKVKNKTAINTPSLVYVINCFL